MSFSWFKEVYLQRPSTWALVAHSLNSPLQLKTLAKHPFQPRPRKGLRLAQWHTGQYREGQTPFLTSSLLFACFAMHAASLAGIVGAEVRTGLPQKSFCSRRSYLHWHGFESRNKRQVPFCSKWLACSPASQVRVRSPWSQLGPIPALFSSPSRCSVHTAPLFPFKSPLHQLFAWGDISGKCEEMAAEPKP